MTSCPLCCADLARSIQAFTLDQIWDSLASHWRIVIPPEVRARYLTTEALQLVECSACGLQYFQGSQAGDLEFYSYVTSLYASDRWEFDLVRAQLRPDDTVLDLGSGPASFLKTVQPIVRQAVGLDTNPRAAELAARIGITVHSEPLTEYAAAHEREFSVITAFQLIEHLPELGTFIAGVGRCLARQGRVYISVPNRQRIGRKKLEPLDCPPHHLSRWDIPQLHYLAERSGLQLTNIWVEPPSYSVAAAEIERTLAHHLRLVGAEAARTAARVCRKVLLNRSGNGLRLPFLKGVPADGFSLLAELQDSPGHV